MWHNISKSVQISQFYFLNSFIQVLIRFSIFSSFYLCYIYFASKRFVPHIFRQTEIEHVNVYPNATDIVVRHRIQGCAFLWYCGRKVIPVSLGFCQSCDTHGLHTNCVRSYILSWNLIIKAGTVGDNQSWRNSNVMHIIAFFSSALK